jgi:NADPH:quinone reductase-like Zn-dependent oxidoreductase
MKNHAPEAVPAQLGEAKRGKSYPRAVDEQLPDVWSRDVELRIRVEACGLCHSDAATVEGIFLIAWPRVPGDEVVGRIDALGPASRAGRSVSAWGRASRRLLWLLRILPQWGSCELPEAGIYRHSS